MGGLPDCSTAHIGSFVLLRRRARGGDGGGRPLHSGRWSESCGLDWTAHIRAIGASARLAVGGANWRPGLLGRGIELSCGPRRSLRAHGFTPLHLCGCDREESPRFECVRACCCGGDVSGSCCAGNTRRADRWRSLLPDTACATLSTHFVTTAATC